MLQAVEDGLVLLVEVDFVHRALQDAAGGDAGNDRAHPVVGRLVVHHHLFHVLGEEIAHGAFDQVGFLKNAGRRRLGSDLLLDFSPAFQQQSQVADEIGLPLALARRCA